jgi:hypothetical protein
MFRLGVKHFFTLSEEHKFEGKLAVFWVVAPCTPVDFYRRFRGAMIALIMEAASTINLQIILLNVANFSSGVKVKSEFTISSTFDCGHLKGSPLHH